jgi:hypothetical protein
MSDTCGCCEGLEVLTPMALANRPGLSALRYRVGVHASFLETMKARLSSSDYPILRRLTTREGQDASMALLDAWATVADVLTFYQERIANEGYLRTATERRSILELARLIGYRLRPGVSASVYLAFTIEDSFDAEIPIGTRAQSLPGPGELPQPFETFEPLDAHSEWNAFKPRLSLPQFITPATPIIYIKGIATNLKPNDPLLIVDSFGEPHFQRVFEAEANVSANRTKVTLTLMGEIAPRLVELAAVIAPARIPEEEGPYSVVIADRSAAEIRQAVEQVLSILQAAKQPTQSLIEAVQIQLPRLEQTYRIDKALNLDVMAAWVLRVRQQLDTILQRLEARPKESTTTKGITIDPDVVPRLEELLTNAPPSPRRKPFAQEIGAAELERVITSLSALVEMLKGDEAGDEQKARAIRAEALKLAQLTYVFAELGFGGVAEWTGALHSVLEEAVKDGPTPPTPAAPVASSLTQLLTPLLKPPALRPIDALRLARPVDQLYAVKANLGPRLLISLQPALNRTLYQARRSLAVKPGPAKAYSLGTQASLFGHNVPRQITYDGNNKPNPASAWEEWKPSPDEKSDKVFLDGAIDTIAPTNYIAILKPGTSQPQVFQVKEVVIRSRTDYGISGKTTEITLNIPEGSVGWWQPDTKSTADFAIIRGTVIYAQSANLDLAEEPIETDVQDAEIELENLYQDLKSGRWLIVSGERTDIMDANGTVITGVRANELVMLARVTEDVRKVPSNTDIDLPGDSPHTTLHLSDPLAYTYKGDSVTIYANVVKATHGESLPEVFGSGDGSQAFQQFALRQVPLTYVAAPTPAGADSTLVVRVNDVQWHEADTLAGLGPTDRRYIIRIDDDGKTSIIFGDGKHGARLPTSIENIKGVYRRGIGKAGNVKAQQISLLAQKPLHVKSVINPIAASGGADRESRDQARRNAPLTVAALDRLVSIQDYADFARTFAGIGKASALRLSDGRREIVHLTIAGVDDIPIDKSSELYHNLRRALQQFGEPYQPIAVELRALSLLVISAKLRLQPDYVLESVEPKIRAALLDAFSFDRRELGQDVTYSEVVSAIQAVEGVAYADLDVLDAVDEERLKNFLEINGEQADKETLIDRLNLILKPRLNPDLAHRDPQTGHIVPAQLAYLDPSVPDTLILTELQA